MKCKFCACLFSLAFFVVSCAQQKSENTTISAQNFQNAIQQSAAQILDVRTAVEYQGGHIKNALQANWNDQNEFESRTQHLDKNKTVYIYCQAGGRSAAAQNNLIAKGYKVVNLEGGMSNWKMNGFPVEGAGHVPQMNMTDVEKIIASNKIVLVDIGADWCPPCRKMLPVLAELKKQPAQPFYFLAVDGGNDIDVMKALHSEGLPTFIIYKNGKEAWRHQGIVSLEDFTNALK